MNIDAMKRDLAVKKQAAADLLEKTSRACEAHEDKDATGKVVAKGREMTADERQAIVDLAADARQLKDRIERAEGDANLKGEIDRLTDGIRPASAPSAILTAPRTLGQQFVASAAGEFFRQKRHHGTRNWSAPVAELDASFLRAATLTSDPASGGKLIQADVRPGILPLPTRRLTVRDLLAPGTTDSNAVTYMVEKTFTNAAAAVAEGAAKPESALIFDQVTDLVQKIAHWLPVTEEMLEDVSQIMSYIDARLRVGIEQTEEDQLLNGNGTPPNISGILDRVGLTAPHVRVDPETNVDAIFIQMMAIFNASLVMPDGHVINPANWTKIMLAKDSTGNYFGAGPFAGPLAANLWGLPVSVTPAIVAGTALTGAFKSQAQIFDKGGIRVEASNSHADFFIKNLVAIRAEERLALAVYRPSAFGTTTALT
jgi:HK97 family phage major capsid protein